MTELQRAANLARSVRELLSYLWEAEEMMLSLKESVIKQTAATAQLRKPDHVPSLLFACSSLSIIEQRQLEFTYIYY